jgi:hypothetical protein
MMHGMTLMEAGGSSPESIYRKELTLPPRITRIRTKGSRQGDLPTWGQRGKSAAIKSRKKGRGA